MMATSRLIKSISGSKNLITGCGTGLGQATLKWFLQHGCGPTLAIDRSIPQNFVSNLEINQKQEQELTIKVHNTFDEDIESSLEEFVQKNGCFDNVINVAGVSLGFMLVAKTKVTIYDKEHINALNNFNTVGTFNVTRLASKYMIQDAQTNPNNGTKCIINTSCISTQTPNLGQSYYSGSKGAIDAMTLCLARELSPYNIRCNTINVGYFDTKLVRANMDMVVNFIENDLTLTPCRLGNPLEFAHIVQTIAENQMINGTCIRIDAGARHFLE